METSALVASSAAESGIGAPQIIIWIVGAALIAFCVYKFVSGRKKLKEKRAAEANADPETVKKNEDEDY